MSDFKVNHVKKVLSVRIYLPAITFRGGASEKNDTLYIPEQGVLKILLRHFSLDTWGQQCCIVPAPQES